MKSESENSAEELIQLRVQHQSVKTRNQILTEQVTRYVQRSRDLEHELCNTQQEIVQLRQQLSVDDGTASSFVASVDFDNCVMTAPLQLTSTFLTNMGSVLPNARNAFLDLNGSSGTTPMYSSMDCPVSSLGLGVLPPEMSTIGLSSYGEVLLRDLNEVFVGYLSDSSWLGFPYSSFPMDAQLEGRFGGQPMMLNPSLSPPATTMTVSPRLHSSVFSSMGHETMITEGPSDYHRSLENVLEAPEEGQPLDDPNCLSLSELFADEIEQMAERRVKRFRKP